MASLWLTGWPQGWDHSEVITQSDHSPAAELGLGRTCVVASTWLVRILPQTWGLRILVTLSQSFHSLQGGGLQDTWKPAWGIKLGLRGVPQSIPHNQ